MDRNETIKEIRAALKRRSGKNWSVTGGKGTAWGWITITAQPARCTGRWRLKPGEVDRGHESYELVDTGEPGGYMTDADRAELTALLGLSAKVHHQGEQVPASAAYYSEYVDRAHGRMPSVLGVQYWD